ncbi:MAG: glycosyltransferase [Patescibacteria group bacterium UBA2163]
MEKKRRNEYLHIGRASDLSGSDRTLYRFFETIPGILSVGTLIVFIILSFFIPKIVAYFTIGFSAYWLFKTIFLTIHLRHSFHRLRHNLTIDWSERLTKLRADDVHHVVIFPFYKEPYEVLYESVRALAESRFNTKQIAVVLGAEERAGTEAYEIAQRVQEAFQDTFLEIIITVHPADIVGEIAGKGSNIAHAAREATKRVVDTHGFAYENVLVSAFDADTVIYPDYFSCVTWNFLTTEDAQHASFQPVPLYNNNIWSSPTLSRILAYSSTFWQLIQQERPERLSTFSSHAIPLKALVEADYWQRNMVNEDSRIFFNLFMHYDGNYRVVPILYPVSMDANVGPGFFSTASRLYKQHLRWMYGSAENIPYLMFHFIKNSRIPLRKKIHLLGVHIEGAWSLAVQPLFLFAVGWLPLLIGGAAFNATVLSYNLPIISSWFLTAAMLGLVFLAIYGMRLMPVRPKNHSRFAFVRLWLQWLLVPFTMIIFSAIPGIEAQLRLAFKKYIGFWVTPKSRENNTEGNPSVLSNRRMEQTLFTPKSREGNV